MARQAKVTDRGKRHARRRGKSREETREQRKPHEYFLIITNGSETEKKYFERIARRMPRHALQIVVQVQNRDPRGVVDYALERVAERNHDHVAVVFDKDDFEHFNNAISRMKAAAQREVEVSLYAAYSNECFELWMLLHFQEVNASLGRDALFEKLQTAVRDIGDNRRYRYDKAAFPFDLLDEPGDQQQAIRRAQRILEEAEQQCPDMPWKINPSTEVHLLVEKLAEFMDE